MKVSIVIPVFRGETILPVLVKGISDSRINGVEYEVLLVCDGCNKASEDIIDKIIVENEFIKAYRLDHNYGQHRALQFGFGKASGDFIVTMDEDLQHDPADIPRLLAKQKEGDFDVVYGRFLSLQQNGVRKRMSGMVRKVLNNLIPDLFEAYSPYRLIRKETALQVRAFSGPAIIIDDFIGRVTGNISFVDLKHHQRYNGKSSYTFFRLIQFGMMIILAYSGIIKWLLRSGAALTLLVVIIIMLGRFTAVNFLPYTTIYFLSGTGLILLLSGYSGYVIREIKNKKNSRPVKLR